MDGQTVITIRKERLKFSIAHATVFPDGTKERLHGHNYLPQLRFELKPNSVMLSFEVYKKAMNEVSLAWDERVLMPGKSPFLEVKSRSEKEVDFQLCGKRYVLPTEEVLFLDLESVSSEGLARVYLQNWLTKLGDLKQYLLWAEVLIEETPGQGASFLWRNS